MTQEDKELLLKDLSARLPYGVRLLHIPSGETTVLEMMNCDAIDGDIHDMISNFQPYLRPMSSMTEEERDEFERLDTKCDKMPTFDYVSIEHYRIFDWLNAHHFDYRGLIPKGLAMAVTKENNPYKK